MNPYNMMIKLGRLIEQGLDVDEQPKEVFNYFSVMSDFMEGKSVDAFFNVFPPIKRYEDDGTWDYFSTLRLKQKLGKTFTRESFQELLMSHCYENIYLMNLGSAFMSCISNMYEKENGRSVMEEWALKNELTVYEERKGELLPKLYRIK
ncbi:hypothetical protein [Paraliobacillus ryukyuensis]|uniref:hypothetical protein n=1 Tax=Paraliobacillus ryukyuensis TaxID=200904 RepID=UPI0009A84FD0|nr:hypothetical protein [Paraliobacillus ryukyuensis]